MHGSFTSVISDDCSAEHAVSDESNCDMTSSNLVIDRYEQFSFLEASFTATAHLVLTCKEVAMVEK